MQIKILRKVFLLSSIIVANVIVHIWLTPVFSKWAPVKKKSISNADFQGTYLCEVWSVSYREVFINWYEIAWIDIVETQRPNLGNISLSDVGCLQAWDFLYTQVLGK